jgi:hypothetical protein
MTEAIWREDYRTMRPLEPAPVAAVALSIFLLNILPPPSEMSGP